MVGEGETKSEHEGHKDHSGGHEDMITLTCLLELHVLLLEKDSSRVDLFSGLSER